MVISKSDKSIRALRKAASAGNLALYLGAGVSIGSGLPSWEKLVAAMYFATLAEDTDRAAIRGAYRNYLLAIAEWHRNRQDGIRRVFA